MSQKIADAVFNSPLPSPTELEAKFTERSLPEGAEVVRVSPSPTGFLHIGTLYAALISKFIAQQTKGVFFLRIEDTDRKREVEGAKELIIEGLHDYGLDADEGLQYDGSEKGAYGPYVQSERREIYHAYIKMLLARGDAYVCFATPEELEKNTHEQQAQKLRPGYYGQWALWREKSEEEVLAKLATGAPYAIRLRSRGSHEKRITHVDVLKGDIELPENDLDVPIMKADGLPTYHLAHAVDDHLMRTTLVLRGDEWLPSVPLHYELFGMLGFTVPRYGHIAPINKIGETGKRKLSKRKDPEADVRYFKEKGYPTDAVIEYMMNLANSNFEDWRRDNPTLPYTDFSFSLERLAQSNGPLSDEVKLRSIALDVVSRMTADEVYDSTLMWSKQYNTSFADVLSENMEYWKRIFAIERGGDNPRKDIALWSEVEEVCRYFLNTFTPPRDYDSVKTTLSSSDIESLTREYAGVFDLSLSHEDWLAQIKDLAEKYGYAREVKVYKENKEKYKGHFGEIAQVLRYTLTGRTNTPDLYHIMQVLGEGEVKKRLGA